jgi:hypothetical protein
MNNNQYCIAGFVKRAQAAGLSETEALALLDKAAGAMDGSQGQDPNAMMQAGSMAGDPNQSVPQNLGIGGPQGGPPPQGGDPSGGIPPELEQMISQLPPEVLAQLVQEIEAEMGGQGGQGGPPQGGDPNGGGQPPQHHQQQQPQMDPSQMKQGSARIIAKEAAYIDGFIGRATEIGYDINSARSLYKHALELISSNPVNVKTASQQDSRSTARFEGFAQRASELGLSKQAAYELFVGVFGNK